MTPPEPKDQKPCCGTCKDIRCPHNPTSSINNLCGPSHEDHVIREFTSIRGCLSHSQAREYLNREVVFSREFHLPKNFPSIKQRQIAYKDFEDEGESWNSISNSPMLEDGDIIQIVRKAIKK